MLQKLVGPPLFPLLQRLTLSMWFFRQPCHPWGMPWTRCYAQSYKCLMYCKQAALRLSSAWLLTQACVSLHHALSPVALVFLPMRWLYYYARNQLKVSNCAGARLIDMVVSPHALLESQGRLRLHANYYITKQIIPALERVISLVSLQGFPCAASAANCQQTVHLALSDARTVKTRLQRAMV